MELKINLGDKFNSKLSTIEQEVETIWKKGELYHVYYTLHGLDHSNYVIDVLTKLINGLNPADDLNETEIFCLLAAAYLHDVGMQDKHSDDEKKAAQLSELKNKPYAVPDLIRDEHHQRSGRYIKDHANDLKLDPMEAECIRLISEGHRQVKLESKDYDDQTIGLEVVRVRLLSALLRLADELDITYKRAPKNIFDFLKVDMPDDSYLQWMKHYYTSGVLITTLKQENGKKKTSIEVHCHYPNEDVGRRITEVLISKPIEETLNEVRLILLECGLNLSLDHKVKSNPDLDEIPTEIYEKYLGEKFKISMELPRTKGFVGRNDELKDLLSSLDKNVIIIEGIAGIGKTYVAAKFAEELKDEYTVYWYENLSEVSTLSSVMNRISIFLKENGKPKISNSIEQFGFDNDVLIALLKEELNSNNFAIFFDNYHKAENELNPLLKQLVSLKSSKIIIITREEPEFYNIVDERENRVTKVKIDGWDFPQTKMMLEARDIDATYETSQKIHDKLHGHPQYLNLFCILSEKSTAGKLLEKLPIAVQDSHNYLEKEVYNSLTSAEKLLLQTVAVFRISETVDAFDSVNRFNDLNGTLDSLIHKFLVNEIGINTYSVHDIIRDFCLSDVSRMKTLKSYHNNAAEYYLSLDDEDPEHILEAAHHFDKAGKKEMSAEVIINNADAFFSKGFWNKIEVHLQDAIKSFQRKTQPKAIQLIAMAHNEIGKLYQMKDDSDSALNHATKALMFFNKINDKRGIFESYSTLAAIFNRKNEKEKAIEYNDKCLKIADSLKNDNLKAAALANRGNYLGSDEKERKLSYYMNSLDFFETKMDTRNIATICSNIANVYADMDNYDKSHEYIERALELEKERNAFYGIANKKEMMAHIFYYDPKKSVNNDSIIKCLKEVLDAYEKTGHIRGTAKVLDFIGDICYDGGNFESALTNFQKAARIYSSLNQQSELIRFNSSIAVCFVKLKDFLNAKIYFEKNLLLNSSSIEDKLSLIEVHLNLGNYDTAFNLSKELIADNTGDNYNNRQYLAPFYLSLSATLLNNSDCAHECLEKIAKTDYEEAIKWDFLDIESVLKETGTSKHLYTDAISLFKSECNYPIIRVEDVKIINEEVGKRAEVFHPFTGSFTITKDDDDLREIMQKIRQGKEIDFDTPEIMGILRDKALVILGFLFKKGFLDYKNIDKQKFDLKLTERGVKILNLS